MLSIFFLELIKSSLLECKEDFSYLNNKNVLLSKIHKSDGFFDILHYIQLIELNR